MKKTFLLISIIILLFSGCKNNSFIKSENKSQNQNSSINQESQTICSEIYPIIPAPKGMSAKETIEYYFKCWKNKDPHGMCSVEYEEKYDSNTIIEFRFKNLTIKSLKEDGYRLALDDYTGEPSILTEIADILKVDFLATTLTQKRQTSDQYNSKVDGACLSWTT